MIVEKFNGEIDFISFPEEGSTFVFTFKLDEVSPIVSNSAEKCFRNLNQDILIFDW